MESSTHVLLCFCILISGKIWNGICVSQKEDQSNSKNQIDLLPGRSSLVHIKRRQSIQQPQCLKNEYGPNCTYCMARDTCEDGHFTCDVKTGRKVCLQGYQGNSCRISTVIANNYYDVTCPENNCRNGGSCASGHCCCREGFTGILCEIEIIECKNNSCLNGGICKDLIGKYECLCKPTFRGKNCEIPVGAHVPTTASRDSGCRSKSCLNNGTCLEDTFLTYCLCPTYYTGEHCETYIGTSSSLPNACVENYYGVTCQTFCKPKNNCFGHYVCDKSTGGKICMSGWHGKDCDTRNIPQSIDPACPKHACKNDGQCFNNRCCCRNNYTGDNCQIESIGCLSSPCKNNATCMNKGNGFTCGCLPNFTGKICENDIRSSTFEWTAKHSQNIYSSQILISATPINSQYTSTLFTDPSKQTVPSTFISLPVSVSTLTTLSLPSTKMLATDPHIQTTSHNHTRSKDSELLLSQVIPSDSEVNSKSNEYHESILSVSDFVPQSYIMSGSMYTTSFPPTRSSDHQIAYTFDSSYSVPVRERSSYVDSSSIVTLFSDIHDRTDTDVSAVASISFSEVADSDTFLLSSFESLFFSPATSPVQIYTGRLENSAMYVTSSEYIPVSSISLMPTLVSSAISPSLNMISSDKYSKYFQSSTQPMSKSVTQTTSPIQPHSLSLSPPLIHESFIPLAQNMDKTTQHTKPISSDHTIISQTFASQNVQPSTATSVQASIRMGTFVNTAYDSSDHISSTKPTTSFNNARLATSSFSIFGHTTSNNINPSTTIKPSNNALEESSSMLFANIFSSFTDTTVLFTAESTESVSKTQKQTAKVSDVSLNSISKSTDIHTRLISSSVIQHGSRVPHGDSLLVRPTAISSASTVDNSETTYSTHSTSLQASINHNLSRSSTSYYVNTHSTTGSNINVTPTIDRSIDGKTSNSIIITSMNSFANAAINTSSIKRGIPGTTMVFQINHSRPFTEMTSSFDGKNTIILTPTPSRNSKSTVQSTFVEYVPPTILVKDLNTDSNEGLSKSWRIALIVVGCALLVVAIVFLAVFLSVRQRRKDSRTISHSPEDIQDYSKEHFSEQPEFNNPTYEIENDSDDDSVTYDIYVVNE